MEVEFVCQEKEQLGKMDPRLRLVFICEYDRTSNFWKKRTEIFCNVPISIVDASLGGSVEVPTVSGGRVKVKIPAGAQQEINSG